MLLCQTGRIGKIGSFVILLTSIVAGWAHATSQLPESLREVRAADSIADSFPLPSARGSTSERAVDEEEPWIEGLENKHVSIFETALEKEFLFRFNTIFPGPIASFSNGATRIVVFKKVGSQLFLLEATDGHLINQDVPLSLVLAEFPVTAEREGVITFDFNAGMSQHFVFSQSWHASDFYSGGMMAHFAAVDTQISYVDEATLLESNRLFIRQVAQVKLNIQRVPLEVRYFLEPYRPNPNIRVTRGGDFKRMGFFEVAPRFNKHGIRDVYATKFDITRPVVFALSANTPSEYRQAVKDGAFYWNRAFGREIVQVIDAPEGVSAPHPNYNVIQWADWPSAGFAYADAQHDPRTGEVLNAQIWLSSAFAFIGKLRAKVLLKDTEQHQRGRGRHLHRHNEKNSTFPLVSIGGFERKPLCFFELFPEGARALAEVAQLEDDEKIFEIAMDFVREITAHEVGHVLGLRHNFAGSLAMNYDRNQRKRHFQSYLANLATPADIIPSSSVMDYNAFAESVFIGNSIREGKAEKALAYDHMAIHHLYEAGVEWGEEKNTKSLLDPELSKQSKPLFCTDSHIMKFYDCMPFDVFSSPSEQLLHGFESIIHVLPYGLLESFVWAKDPPLGLQPKKLEEVELWPKLLASWQFYLYSEVLQLMSADNFIGSLLQVTRSFDQVSDVSNDRIEQITSQLIVQDILDHGGISQVFAFLPANFVEQQMARFSEILQAKYLSGTGPGGHGYEFSEAEVAFISKQAQKFYTLFAKEAHKSYLNVFKGAENVKDTRMANELAEFFSERARHYMMSTKTSMLKGSLKSEKVHVPVDAPELLYDFELRKLAAELLSSRMDNPFWGKTEKVRLKKQYESFLNSPFGDKKFSELEEDKLSSDLLVWYWEQQEILNQL